jgi:sucrose 6(F)-phosphate phosphorylase
MYPTVNNLSRFSRRKSVCFNTGFGKYFPGIFGSIHLLPPFPSTSDRGFAPVTYKEIDPKFGSWHDIQKLSKTHDILLDFRVNHLSQHSGYFQDFVRNGRRSPYADLFITLDKVWPDGMPVDEDVRKIFLRRPLHPFLDVRIERDGSTEKIWATFGKADTAEQIDIDVNSRIGRQFIHETLAFLASQGVHTLRLDAVAFVIKKAGTSCFLVEPQISEFLDWIHHQARDMNIGLLLEVHTRPEAQAELARRGYWVYNFVLPLLVLHTILNGTSAALKAHLTAAPRQQITMLDCHDGIPVQPDITGVLDMASARRIVQFCEEQGANVSRIYSKDHQGADGFDAHQINCTYFSALGSDEDAYILARAIQFFAPGIPQVYYMSLLAGENTPAEIELQADRRAINRHNFSLEEIDERLHRPVVQRLLKLIRFRNECPAFEGEFSVVDCEDHRLILGWVNKHNKVLLNADLLTKEYTITRGTSFGEMSEFTF